MLFANALASRARAYVCMYVCMYVYVPVATVAPSALSVFFLLRQRFGL